MHKFDRYVLSQLMVLFGFFALVLVAIYWINQAIILFDQLIADGHTAGIFLELTALTLPPVIGQVTPIASFAASVYVINRLINDSEINVALATGMSPWRIARPVLYFGLIVAVLMLILCHSLIPNSRQLLRDKEQELSGSIAAQLLKEGTFQHPLDGITFYIRDIDINGQLRDVFLSDSRDDGKNITYTAENAYLVDASEDDDTSVLKLVMLNGLAQVIDENDLQLSTTYFENLTYDISSMITPVAQKRRRIEGIPTWQLLWQTADIAIEARDTEGEVLEEAHLRTENALLCIVAVLIGYGALIAAGYSRLGATRPILFAIFLLVLVKIVESSVTDPVQNNADLWPLVYLPSIIGLIMACALIHIAARSRRVKRTPDQNTPDGPQGAIA